MSPSDPFSPLPDNLEDPGGTGIVPEVMVVKTEKHWVWAVAGVLAIIVVVIVATGAAYGLHPPSNAQLINPAEVYQAAEFSESNLGTALEPDGTATVRMIAQQYSFVPACVTVPYGRKIHFRLTSADVIHGFLLAETNINVMIVPGYVSEVTGNFPAVGEYRMPCHEYCGLGHAGMEAIVRVVPREQYPVGTGTNRMRCDEK